mmetsp:Transcript_102326/g.312970  ORF Transcript_102326/g.312970 Transcript_102326/m.312970 type:complete len:283 (-) Transcript_102326:3-851(-)
MAIASAAANQDEITSSAAAQPACTSGAGACGGEGIGACGGAATAAESSNWRESCRGSLGEQSGGGGGSSAFVQAGASHRGTSGGGASQYAACPMKPTGKGAVVAASATGGSASLAGARAAARPPSLPMSSTREMRTGAPGEAGVAGHKLRAEGVEAVVSVSPQSDSTLGSPGRTSDLNCPTGSAIRRWTLPTYDAGAVRVPSTAATSDTSRKVFFTTTASSASSSNGAGRVRHSILGSSCLRGGLPPQLPSVATSQLFAGYPGGKRRKSALGGLAGAPCQMA